MNKRNCFLLFIPALLLTALSLLLGLRSMPQPILSGRAIKIPAAEIDGFDVYRGDELLISLAKNTQGEWRVSIPARQVQGSTADRIAVNELLAFVSRTDTQLAREVTPADAGIDIRQNLQFIARGGKRTSSIFLGNYSLDGQYRYFVSDDDPQTVLQVESGLARVFDREPSAFRSLDIFDIGNRAPDRITLSPGAGGQEIVLEAIPGGWVITSPINWPADAQQVNRLLRLCAMLRAEKILPPDTPPAPDNAPAITLRIGNNTQTVAFSGSHTDPTVIASPRSRRESYETSAALLWEVKNANADRYRSLILPLLQDKTPAMIEMRRDDGQVLRLALSGQQWINPGNTAQGVEKSMVDNLLKVLENLMIVGVADEDGGNAAEFGLDLPELSISVSDVGGAELTALKIASVPVAAPLQGADRFFVSVTGRKQVLELQPLVGTFLMQDFIQYRNRMVNEIDFKDILKIKIETPDFTREYWGNTPTQYQMVKPESALLSESGNWEFLSLVRDLAYLRCEGFVPEKNTQNADFGLDQPVVKTILTMRSTGGGGTPGKELTLLVGSGVSVPAPEGSPIPAAEYHYAKLSDNNVVFILNKKFVDRLLVEYK